MVNKQNIMSFLDYNYTPFRIKQCIIRLIVIWILSIALCFIGTFSLLLVCLISFFNIAISTVFCILIIKFRKAKISRFLCDGLTFLYIAIILNMASYRIISLQINDNWILALIFLVLLFICICFFILIVYFNIKSDKYNAKSIIKKSLSFPLAGSVCGIVVAKLFLQNISQNSAVLILLINTLLLSFIVSIGSLALLKAFLIRYIKKADDN